MNHIASDRPRFACRLARGALTLLGNNSTGVPRGPGAGHVATCEECQMHFAACDDFDLALKRDALAAALTPSATLEQDILRAVRQAAPPARRSAGRAMALALAGGFACAIAAVVFFQWPGADSLPSGPQITGVSPVPPVPPTMASLLESDPLQSEVDAVISDAQSAVQFLARNFLPSSGASGSGRGE
jgi:hypothetical protein